MESKHIHLIGICGTAMASLAGILKTRNHRVTGSDLNCYPPMSTQLEELGIEVMQGYNRENLIPSPDLVIVGNVIQKKFDEAQYLISSDIPYTSLPKAMADFVIQDRNSLVMAGTHGKTTTTSMMAWVMSELGMEPGFLIGGIASNFAKSFQDPKSDWFVIEGDEYDTAFFDKVPKFIYYKPKYVTITSIEFDHADIYSDISEITDAFEQLVKLVPKQGHIVAWAGSELIDKVLKQSQCKVIRYGLAEGEYQARNIVQHEASCQFDFYHCAEGGVQSGGSKDVQATGEKLQSIELPMSGEHNVLNAVSVLSHAALLGWDLKKVAVALKGFKGVKRRQEILGMPGGIRVIEDFAHHPTAVKMTLDGLKKQFPEGRLFAVFEPRSATSRRSYFQKQYAESFASADHVVIAKPYDQTRIEDGERFSSDQLVNDLSQLGIAGECLPGADEIIDSLVAKAESSDTIVIMSNGGFDGIYDKILSRLEPV